MEEIKNNLSELRCDGYIQNKDVYSDYVYRIYYGFEQIIYYWREPYYLKDEKSKNLSEWKKKIPFGIIRWELVPYEVQKDLLTIKEISAHYSLNKEQEKQNKNMNIIQKYALVLTKEPQKSFRKAGITNGDDILTEDGQKVFLSWLLHAKYADDFKKEIVDDMLKDLEEDKK